ncbi:glycosyltransferase, partial [Ruminococcaceae bacterium OttesenSCG-928-A16]|nr:glycosyltransferase [Ruminococcaceae bacterium OttesenSCG-928-A16]
MQKILFVISTLTGGGAERALCNITLALPSNVSADILVNSISDEDYPHAGNVISLNLPPTKQKGILYHIRSILKRFFALRKLKKNGNYSACISFMDSANIANVLSGKKHCKTILSVRINLSHCASTEYQYFINPLVKLLYPRADKIISLSKGVENDLVHNFHLSKDKNATIYNGYDLLNIYKLAQQPQKVVTFETGDFYFVT